MNLAPHLLPSPLHQNGVIINQSKSFVIVSSGLLQSKTFRIRIINRPLTACEDISFSNIFVAMNAPIEQIMNNVSSKRALWQYSAILCWYRHTPLEAWRGRCYSGLTPAPRQFWKHSKALPERMQIYSNRLQYIHFIKIRYANFFLSWISLPSL
jgi:hypothetical protein